MNNCFSPFVIPYSHSTNDDDNNGNIFPTINELLNSLMESMWKNMGIK
jgi:hypothetical protein